MTSRRHFLTGSEVTLSALATLTTFSTLLSWQGLSLDPSAYLVPLFWFCLGIGLLGLTLRTLPGPTLLVPLIQVAAAGLVLNHWWAPVGPLSGWVPTRGSVEEAIAVLRQAVEEAGNYAAPVPADAVAFLPVMVGAGCLVALGVDFLACTLRRVPLAGLPLLAAFTAPVTILGGVSWTTFALAAISFVFLLTADQAARLAYWGRSLSGAGAQVVEDRPRQIRLGALWPASARLGLAGVGLAVLAPALLPAGPGLLDGDGGVNGRGSDEVDITDPMVDMRRRLIRGEDVPLVRIVTDDPAPSYLRTSVLDEFDGKAWRPSQRDIPVANRVTGKMPAAPGLSPDTPRVEHEMSLSITEQLDSTWLPTPYPATVVKVSGDWRYDDDTLDLISAGDGVNTQGLEYKAVGLELRPVAEQLVSAAPPPRSLRDAGTELPSPMPSSVADTALRVTSEASSQFERAVMLQEWFRHGGGFEYSLEEGRGSDVQQLEAFLGTGPGSRVGYCEQFAAAMAMMARSLDIPARLAVGFLRPDRDGEDSWVYSAHDLHSWPELYFEGAGWIRFEPTPQDRTADRVPAYTSGTVPRPEVGPSPSASATPEEPVPSQQVPETGASSTGSDDHTSLARWGGVLGGSLVVLAAGLAPRLLRGWARRRRFGAEGSDAVAEGAWAEVRATAIDLGRGWVDGTTTRQQAGRLLSSVGPELSAPLESLALLVERARYSRAGLTAEECDRVRTLSEQVAATMLAAADPSARRRATWLPRSLLRGRRRDVRQAGRQGLSTSRGKAGAAASSSVEQTDVEQVSL